MIGAFTRLRRGETTFDFAGRWRRWFVLSGTIILIGMISIGFRGLNFSVDFKGGTIWQVPTTASVTQVRDAVSKINSDLAQSQIQVETNRETNQRIVQVEASAKSSSSQVVTEVSAVLGRVAGTSPNNVNVQSVGAAWGSDITDKAVKAVIVFLLVVSVYIWFRFEGKMALSALVALVHDILITAGIYSLSGLQVSPDTVIAFLTILGYSLYDTIVVFDKVQENTRALASSNRQGYTEMVNLSMNQVLARSLNTSFVAIIPILSILVIGSGLLGASTLNDFGLALFIGLTTGAYSSLFIASPLLGILKEREPRYREIRRRLAETPTRPAKAPAGRRRPGGGPPRPRGGARPATPEPAAPPVADRRVGHGPEHAGADDVPVGGDVAAGAGPAPAERPVPASNGATHSSAERAVPVAGATPVPPRSVNRPPPRPRKKTRRR